MHRGVGGEERRSVSRRGPYRKLNVEAPEQRREIVRPGDRHGDVADGVLEDQVPPDDPRDQLSQGRIRVGVGAPRLRDHGGKLGVAQTGERAAYTEQQERQDERGPGAATDEMPGGVVLPCGRGPDGSEDPGADHGADAEHDEIAGAQGPLEGVRTLALDEQLGNRLAAEELMHRVLRHPLSVVRNA